jgi:hypothetical protein
MSNPDKYPLENDNLPSDPVFPDGQMWNDPQPKPPYQSHH